MCTTVKKHLTFEAQWRTHHRLSYLSNQTGEDEDADEKVRHLKDDLEDGYRLRETTDVDQTAHSIVVTTQVPVENTRYKMWNH